jgi:hypothetical protein
MTGSPLNICSLAPGLGCELELTLRRDVPVGQYRIMMQVGIAGSQSNPGCEFTIARNASEATWADCELSEWAFQQPIVAIEPASAGGGQRQVRLRRPALGGCSRRRPVVSRPPPRWPPKRRSSGGCRRSSRGCFPLACSQTRVTAASAPRIWRGAGRSGMPVERPLRHVGATQLRRRRHCLDRCHDSVPGSDRAVRDQVRRAGRRANPPAAN